jgi:hypothetical protein
MSTLMSEIQALANTPGNAAAVNRTTSVSFWDVTNSSHAERLDFAQSTAHLEARQGSCKNERVS